MVVVEVVVVLGLMEVVVVLVVVVMWVVVVDVVAENEKKDDDDEKNNKEDEEDKANSLDENKTDDFMTFYGKVSTSSLFRPSDFNFNNQSKNVRIQAILCRTCSSRVHGASVLMTKLSDVFFPFSISFFFCVCVINMIFF